MRKLWGQVITDSNSVERGSSQHITSWAQTTQGRLTVHLSASGAFEVIYHQVTSGTTSSTGVTVARGTLAELEANRLQGEQGTPTAQPSQVAQALAFYADPYHYGPDIAAVVGVAPDGRMAWDDAPVIKDGGALARAALGISPGAKVAGIH